MIPFQTLNDRDFPTGHQSCLQPICVSIGRHSQRFELKPESLIKLTLVKRVRTQGLNRASPVSNRCLIGDFFEQIFRLASFAFSINGESEIVSTYFPCSMNWKVHQYLTHLFKQIQIPQSEGMLCELD